MNAVDPKYVVSPNLTLEECASIFRKLSEVDTPLDPFIQERLDAGSKFQDLLLILPDMPLFNDLLWVNTKWGRLKVRSSRWVDDCYLIDSGGATRWLSERLAWRNDK